MDQVKIQRPFRSNQVNSEEQFIDKQISAISMLMLLKEVSCISIMVNVFQKLEDNNWWTGRKLTGKFTANYREEWIIARQFVANSHTQRIVTWKFVGLKTIGVAKIKSLKKPGNSSKFVCINFAQYTVSVILMTSRELRREKAGESVQCMNHGEHRWKEKEVITISLLFCHSLLPPPPK